MDKSTFAFKHAFTFMQRGDLGRVWAIYGIKNVSCFNPNILISPEIIFNLVSFKCPYVYST